MDAPCQPLAAPRVARPHTRRQAVFAVIRQPHRLIVVFECHDGQHRTKSFFPHNAHLVRYAGQHSGSVEIYSQLRQRRPARQNPSPERLRIFHMRFHDPQLPLPDHRPHIRLRIHAIAHAQLLRFLRAGGDKRFVQTAMHVAALDRQACLPRVDERSPHRRTRSHVQVGIVQHQHGIFPTQLQHHRKQALRRGGGDPLTGRNAAGKYQLVDRRTQQRRPRRALANHHLKHILGHTRTVQQRRQLQRRQRRQLRRLQHHRVPRNQRRKCLCCRN